MFGLGKKKDNRQKEYENLMKQAMEAQRSGDIVGCSQLHEKAEALLKEINKR